MPAQRELFNVRTPPDALQTLLASLPPRRQSEMVRTEDGLDRVLADDIASASDLPTFRRSTMDGFAVRAADTYGATEGLPAYLKLTGGIPMGQTPTVTLGVGDCARIATGGMLPAGADAVVMVEQTQEAADATGIVEIMRPAAPGENVVQAGEDVRTGAPILPRGHRLRPQDVGGLLAL